MTSTAALDIEATLAKIDEVLAAPVESQSARYLARLDAELAGYLTDRDRAATLKRLLSEWRARFGRFQIWAARDDGPEIFEGFKPPLQAADFHIIFAELDARIARTGGAS